MKKRAKFAVEIEYDSDQEYKLNPDTINILRLEQEGDYAGLVLALSSGLLFAKNSKVSALSAFKDKLRILRSVGSTLVNGLMTLRHHGTFTEDQMSDVELDMVSGIVKHITDILSFGIATMLEITPDQVEECNREYDDVAEHNRRADKYLNKDKPENNEGQRPERSSEEDFL